MEIRSGALRSVLAAKQEYYIQRSLFASGCRVGGIMFLNTPIGSTYHLYQLYIHITYTHFEKSVFEKQCSSKL